MEPHLSIDEVARRTGLTAHTLRYYERIGLIGPVGRTASGQRRYLTSRHERTGRRDRRVYEITEQGRVALTDAKAKVKELFGELIEGK
ncbi:MerR family DNA-binding transcriptional regulator [Ectopseudomonas khazarica]|uniref:MerR family DNA-binding transcriptional regulator n=1 Tax=Ectopseudomonas khazarica TaxID=2502979 RepID=UPI003B9383FD